jgi:hypothetical protein
LQVSAKVEFYRGATPQNFQLLVFWRRAYAAYVFARGKFSILYISVAPKLRPKPPHLEPRKFKIARARLRLNFKRKARP